MSIRLNSKEESILKYLTNSFEKDKSSVIKSILFEKYEELLDMKVIDEFETKNAKKKAVFHSAEDILNSLLQLIEQEREKYMLTTEIKNMPTKEKIVLMEEIWDTLSYD